jgi:hypothetical protein
LIGIGAANHTLRFAAASILLGMLRQEDDQTVWTTASEKIRKITIDGERRYRASQKNPAPAHLDLKTSL